MAYCKSAVVKGFSLPGLPVYVSFFGLTILICVYLSRHHTFLCISEYFPCVWLLYFGLLRWFGFRGNDVFCEYGLSALLDLVFFRFVASFRRVGFDTSLVKSCVWACKYLCLLGRLCVKFWKLMASHFFTGWALVVKLVVSDRSYIGLFSCACFYITR